MKSKKGDNKIITTLDKYSKSDLIWIIGYLVKWGGDYYLERAISELSYKKDIDRINEAERYSKLASEKRQAYIDLLAPFDGQPWLNIPHAIIIKADKLMKEAQAADKQYMKLMGIKGV